MSVRSLTSLRVAVSLSAILAVSACDGDRPVPLSEVDTIDIPPADVGQQANQNISNPTLEIPATFEVTDGDLLTLVWSEEFDGPTIDPEVWFFESGDGSQYEIPGWGNNELQYYLPDNAMIVNGVLEITARRETVGDFDYTSARITTQDRFAFQYGRIEARIKMPSGQGLWPAFWMLSQDSDYLCGGDPCVWAAIGEIDIVEAVNLDGTGGNEIFGTIHYGGEFPANQSTETRYTPSVDITEDFHTYALEWDADEIRWYFDGQLYAMENSWFSLADDQPYPAPFNQPFHVLLNVAVGGNFPGSPNGTTPFPATMEVDWVRVYSGEDSYVPADSGTIPDDVIYASDPNVTVDLTPGFDPFGSGSVFADVTSDRDFSPVLGITTGNGYGAQVGQLGLTGFTAGFADAYERLEFKIKNVNNDLIRVKFDPDGTYLDITLTSSAYATALGNGWYQVSVPIADFAGTATGTTLVFETDNTSPNPFTFLMTDIGFSGTVGGGGGGGAGTGVVPDDVVYATDPGEMVDLATTITAFGTSSTFDGAYALDADFNPAFQAISGSGYGLDHIVQLGFIGLPQGFATGYESFSFKIKSADLPGNTVVVKLEGGGGLYGDVVLSNTAISTPLGNDWYQVVLPMADFTNVADAVGFLFERVGAQTADGGTQFSMLVTDIGFNNPTGGGGGAGTGVVPDDVVYATDPGEMVDLATTITAFGTSSTFDGAYALDADFNPAFQAISGSGYGLDHIVQLGFIGLPQGFATGYESFSFKIKSADLPGNTVVVKLEGGGGLYGDVVLSNTAISTPLGNGWYQVVLPMADFTNVADAVGFLFERVGAQTADGGTQFSMLVTDIGFNNPTGGGGGGGEIAVNGGFESGDFTGWTQFEATPGDQTVNTGMAGDTSSEGTFHLEIDNTAAGTNSLVKQERVGLGTVTPGIPWTVTFDARGSFGPGGVAFAQVFSETAGGNENCTGCGILGGAPLALDADPTVWTSFTFSGTAGPTTESLTLQLEAVTGGAGSFANVFYDNISIVVN